MTLTDRLVARLATMLAYRRPYGSASERAYGERWLAPLGATRDLAGNWIFQVGSAPVLWSAHTDTAHSRGGSLRIILEGDVLTARDMEPLGADDGVGCFLLHELARRRVPGRYVWHSGEERGCIGSRALVQDPPEWLSGINYVIALDRRGTGDVITHQMWRRTASDAFGHTLAAYLNTCGLQYAPSDKGSYTDSETYAGTVGECTNLSVGFYGEHSSREYVDVSHVLALLDALSDLDVMTLPCVREPVAEPRWSLWNLASDDCAWRWPYNRAYQPHGPTIGKRASGANGLYLSQEYSEVLDALTEDGPENGTEGDDMPKYDDDGIIGYATGDSYYCLGCVDPDRYAAYATVFVDDSDRDSTCDGCGEPLVSAILPVPSPYDGKGDA